MEGGSGRPWRLDQRPNFIYKLQQPVIQTCIVSPAAPDPCSAGGSRIGLVDGCRSQLVLSAILSPEFYYTRPIGVKHRPHS